MWVQEAVKEGRIRMGKVWGEENVADHLTKPKTRVEVERLVARVGGEFRREGGGDP